jgi:hypothetical protein
MGGQLKAARIKGTLIDQEWARWRSSNRIPWYGYLIFVLSVVFLFIFCYLIAITNHPSTQPDFQRRTVHGAIWELSASSSQHLVSRLCCGRVRLSSVLAFPCSFDPDRIEEKPDEKSSPPSSGFCSQF